MNQALKNFKNYYDSHVHWLAVGEFSRRLDLSSIKNKKDLINLNIKEHNFKGDWLLAYGWDDKNWESSLSLSLTDLDEVFPDYPVALSKTDGHALWCNSQALKLIDIDRIVNDSRVLKDDKGRLTGVLLEDLRDIVFNKLPLTSNTQLKEQLLIAQDIFLSHSFSDIRDVGCRQDQWQAACELRDEQKLKLGVECFFYYNLKEDIDIFLNNLLKLKKTESTQIQLSGVKFFLDGSLGSETAYISEKYNNSDSQGLCLLTAEKTKNLISKIWSVGLDVAVHALGDQSASLLVTAATELWEKGVKGRLHLEHGQMLSGKTIKMLKGKNVIVHMQPCHLLSDKDWLFDKLPGSLHDCLFSWAKLEESGIPFYFGSDAPLETPNVENNLKALKLGESLGIENINGDPLDHHRKTTV